MLRWRRTHLRTHQVGASPASRLEIYDRDDRLGRGRCMSFHVGPREIMRFDLFVPAHAHDGPLSPRRYYPDGLAFEAYVELALADMARDLRIRPAALAWARTELLRP